MLVAGAALFLTAIAYYYLTQDTPDGDFKELPPEVKAGRKAGAKGSFWKAFRDVRVWSLAVLYASSFGMELTLDNFAALYFTDYFHLSLQMAGIVASSFGMMNLFARALGGIVSDRCNLRWGLRGRALLLGGTIAAEGLAMLLFSQMHSLPLAIATMMLTGLFVKMSNGANYAVVPFINRGAVGAVAGIVGAGGNLGAVMAGFLFKSANLTYPQAFLILGCVIFVSSVCAFAVRFSETDELAVKQETAMRLNATLIEAKPVTAGTAA
jgi:NNP family nitrate/nitrite transporter-like MFS transporter